MSDAEFLPDPGHAVEVAPLVRRIVANNPGPFTFTGTNTYVIGRNRVAVVDPGPDDDAHLRAVLDAVAGETVTHVILTHGHRDHSGAARALAAATGAPLLAARSRTAAPAADGTAGLDAPSATGLAPDRVLADGDIIAGDGWSLTAIATPGHASDHVALALAGTDIAFSGDHVMGWSTSVVAPPDGSMRDYITSLDRLLLRDERLYLPGHGDVIADGPARVRALRAHRQMREAAILARLRSGDETIAEIVAVAYRDTDPRLHRAAALSVLAHIEDLVARGLVQADDKPGLDTRFTVPR